MAQNLVGVKPRANPRQFATPEQWTDVNSVNRTQSSAGNRSINIDEIGNPRSQRGYNDDFDDDFSQLDELDGNW